MIGGKWAWREPQGRGFWQQLAARLLVGWAGYSDRPAQRLAREAQQRRPVVLAQLQASWAQKRPAPVAPVSGCSALTPQPAACSIPEPRARRAHRVWAQAQLLRPRRA